MKSEGTLRLGDVASVISGYAFKSSVFGDQGVPVIKIANIRSGYLDFSDTQKVDEENFEKLNEKYRVNPGDILISLTGSHVTQPNSVVGRVAQAPQGLNKCLLNQRAGKVILKRKDRCDAGFLYRYLTAAAAQGAIASMASGAASQANVSPSQVESLPLVLPPLAKQQRIASILSVYDDLIENNTRRIEILEEMARRLYEEWFVHFRFPGHEEVSFKEIEHGEIPEAWEIVNLVEVVDLTMGQSPKSEFYNDRGEGLPFHQGVTDFGNYFPSNRLYCTVENRIAEEGDILFSVRAPVGRINISKEKIVIGRGVSALRSKAGHQIFLLSQLRKIFEEEDSIGNGAIFKAVTKRDMQTIKLVQPDVHCIEGFESIAGSLWKQIRVLSDKNINLRAQRDLLLPKLVSGEIDVSDISMPDDKEVEAA